jgi:hypothetical protein
MKFIIHSPEAGNERATPPDSNPVRQAPLDTENFAAHGSGACPGFIGEQLGMMQKIRSETGRYCCPSSK